MNDQESRVGLDEREAWRGRRHDLRVGIGWWTGRERERWRGKQRGEWKGEGKRKVKRYAERKENEEGERKR